ncbi:MAG TPA: HEAT repeat domain-containing protein [Spirochaetota bacterium]|nr:HEAT repeat domain-containing protein [Spirochaetota bacterium]
MNKRVIILLAVLLVTTIGFAADADKYIADLDPAKDENTIVQAADWLGEKKEDEAVGKLVALLTDSRFQVRLHSAMALGYIGEEDAVEALNNVLLSDKHATVRYAALLSTVRIGSKKSYETWKKAKESETDPYIKDFLSKMEEKEKGK